MKVHKVAAILACVICTVSATQPSSFTFAGLGTKTTIAELKKKYPRSTALETIVYLSDEESHDHISTIGLSNDGSVRVLTITFERQQSAARPTYPSCEKLLSLLKSRYGNPANTVDGQEEQAQNRRLEWKTPMESLTLSCFRMPRQPLFAERITITSRK